LSFLDSPPPPKKKKFAALGDCLVRLVGSAGTHCNICVFSRDLQPHDTYQRLRDLRIQQGHARMHARTD